MRENRLAKGFGLITTLRRLFHYKDDLVDAVYRRVKCNIKTIERVAFEELKVVNQLAKTTPPKAMWKLPSIET